MPLSIAEDCFHDPLWILNSADTQFPHIKWGAYNRGNYKQGEKTALRLGENNNKCSTRQRINLKNIQATPAAQLQKNK